MSRFVTYGFGAAAAVLVFVAGVQLLSSAPGGIGTTASPTPTTTPDTVLRAGPYTLEGPEGPPIRVSIPASGWSVLSDFDAIAKGDEVDGVPDATILLWAWDAGTGFYVYGDPCRWQSTTPETPVTSVDEIAAALASQASRDASEPVDVTVGGYAGKAITLHVPADANFNECEDGQFGTFGTKPDALARYQQGPGQTDELWILDVDGAIVTLDATYGPDTPTDLIEEMRSIVESATFVPYRPTGD